MQLLALIDPTPIGQRLLLVAKAAKAKSLPLLAPV
jgi:hypothetical protein